MGGEGKAIGEARKSKSKRHRDLKKKGGWRGGYIELTLCQAP